MNLKKFIKQFTSEKVIKEELVVLDNKYYLVNNQLKDFYSKIKLDPFYIGEYIGKQKGENFFPSLTLVKKIAKFAKKTITLTNKGEWLFSCGRDIFSDSIEDSKGKPEPGSLVIIKNKYSYLGFGKVMKKITGKGAVIKNILDIGDFLRRE